MIGCALLTGAFEMGDSFKIPRYSIPQSTLRIFDLVISHFVCCNLRLSSAVLPSCFMNCSVGLALPPSGSLSLSSADNVRC